MSTHRGTFGSGGYAWYIGGILVVAGVVNAGKGALGMGLVTVLAGAVVLLWPLFRWKQQLDIDATGFTWTRLHGGPRRFESAQVQKVTHITHHTRMGSYEEVQIELTSGETLGIAGVENAEQAAALVHAFTQAGRTPAATGGTGWKAPGA